MAEAEHLQEGVVVVVVRDGRLLMIQRAPGVLAGGAWCFPGGAIEPGESQPDAVVREFHEEVGGCVRPVRKIWEYTRPDGRLRLHWWLADFHGDELRANPLEVAEIDWCTPAQIVALPDALQSNLAFLREMGHKLLQPETPD